MLPVKDDPYRHLLKSENEITGAKRVNLFMKESQQMVKKTQDLIRSIGVKGGSGKGDRRALEDQTTGEDGEGSTTGGKGTRKEDRPFYLAQDSDWQACGAMFEILWYPSLATFSVLLEENESEAMIALCLDGYRHAIRISNALHMETSRLAFVTSLKKFTLLGSSKEMRSKNILAVRMLLQIVNSEGDSLKESWGEVLNFISECERLHLIATSNKPNVEVFVGETQLKGAAPAPAAPSPSQVAVNREKNREVDSVNASRLLIDVTLIERVFIHSANLNGDAIVDFVTALVRVSEHELSSPQPRVFSLQKIVEITYYNMGRIRLVWSKIWVILSDFFIKAGCHPNLGVSLYAIDSLRQLAMKFLEKDELAAFQFQKQFFRPFELVMQQNASHEARELIIQCLSRMILARKKNIKSGWRAVFVVLAIAGQQSHPPLVQSSADLLSSIMEQNFALITEIDTMDEAVNALVAFGTQSVYTEVSLQAIHYLTLCAAHMGAVPQSAVDGTRSAASTPRHRSGSISSASGAPLVASSSGAPASQLSLALAADAEDPVAHAASYPVSAPSTPAAANVGVLSSLPNLSVASQAHLLKVWFLLLTGLSRLVNDGRAEVRHLALTTLFAILNENGHVFSASTWRAIFHGVLLPIFDDVKHELPAADGQGSPHRTTSPSSPTDPAPDDALSVWLQTTCLEALSSLIQLFSRFYSTTHFLLPELVRLLSGCMQQENEALAKVGVDCLAVLMKEGAHKWSVGSTWIVLEAVMDVIKRTLPTSLLSPKVRQLLSLPAIKGPAPKRGPHDNGVDERPAISPSSKSAAQEETKEAKESLPSSSLTRFADGGRSRGVGVARAVAAERDGAAAFCVVARGVRAAQPVSVLLHAADPHALQGAAAAAAGAARGAHALLPSPRGPRHRRPPHRAVAPQGGALPTQPQR